MTNVTRRDVLKLSGLGLLSLAAAGPLARTVMAGETESIAWERFLELCHELAAIQVDPNWDQIAYTKTVQKLIRRIKLDDPTVADFIADYKNKYEDFPEIRTMYYKQDFMVSMLEFEPGEDIPLHDHPDMTGVIFCAAGSVEVDHYDRLNETAANGNPLLQAERSLLMTAGDTAALTATRGNIHELRANEFSRMIDVFTPPYDRDKIQRARYYTRNDRPYADRNNVFEAEASIKRV